MSRRLIIMRHAKSSHADPSLSDHARPLNERGRKEAPEIARRLVELDWIPDQVISSDSRRTRQTWEVMAPAFDDEPIVEFDEELYLSGAMEIINALEQVPDHIETVLVLGHNPGWESALAYFSGEFHQMTTANAALLSAEGAQWKDVLRAGAFRLVEILRPRSL